MLSTTNFNLNGSDFKSQYEKDQNAKLLDVRTPSEYNDFHIQDAFNIDILAPDFTNKLGQLDTSCSYYVYCRSGNRSGQACQLMNQLGFKVYNLDGGISTWPKN
jgi:rhodanese-related sulfurtransferase